MNLGVYGYIATVRPLNIKKVRVGLPMTVVGQCHVNCIGITEAEFYQELVASIQLNMFEQADRLGISLGNTRQVVAVIDFLKVEDK